jgi:hypothetical protein
MNPYYPLARLCSISLFLATLLVAGCDSEPTLISVRGKVSYREQPLPRGTILLTPDASRGCSGAQASAEIQADGSYTLYTHRDTHTALGVAPGWYRVTILAVEAPLGGQSTSRFVAPRSLLPEKYRDPDQSGLSCEVKPGKDNVINFNLE